MLEGDTKQFQTASSKLLSTNVQKLVIRGPGARVLYIPRLGSEPTEEMGHKIFDGSRGDEISIVNAPRAGWSADIWFHFGQ
jgi:hypothetical protein